MSLRKQQIQQTQLATVWFMVVDPTFRYTLNGVDSVDVPSDGYIKQFLIAVKASNNEAIKDAGGKLLVWKLHTPRESWEIQEEGYLASLRCLPNHKEGARVAREEQEREEQDEDEEEEEGGDGDEGEGGEEEKKKKKKPKDKGKGKAKPKENLKVDLAWPLAPDNKISVHLKELDSGVCVLVQLLTGDGNVNNMDDELVLQSELIKIYEAFFVNVGSFDSGSFRHSDIELNEIEIEWRPPPDFVTGLEQTLDSKPGIVHDVRDAFRIILNPESQAAYVDLRSESSERPWREANLAEITHSAFIAFGKWEKCWKGPIGRVLKEKAANAMFFFKIAVEDPIDNDITVQLDASWPFYLITKCQAVRPLSAQYRKLKPRSDFLVLKSGLPRLLVEVNSTAVKDWPPDLIRMLLQGASIVRFANTFLDEFKEKRDFVLIAIFIRDEGTATRHALYQRGNPRDSQAVYYHTKEFDFATPIGRVEFTRQLYNLVHKLKPSVEDVDSRTKDEIEKLSNVITKHKKKFGLKSFNTTQGSKKKPTRTGDGDGGGGGGPSTAESAELQARGYEVKPGVIDSSGVALEPLCESPPHILTVYQTSDPSNELIAKKLRKDSHELTFLRQLNTIHPKSEHVVSLHDSFVSFDPQFTSWVILPKMDTVVDWIEFAPQKLCGKVTEVCWGLIKGLAYLHGLCIAHRDIKPDNLLVDQAFCLKIIDFDIALQVKNEDEEVDDHCGTVHWIAPEIEEKLMYSPIKADRWSCGRVILCLLDELSKEDKRLRTIGRKLQVHDPRQRPSLLEWPSWLDRPPSNIANVLKAGERKASRPLRDTMGGNEENTKFRKVKKQRVIESR